MELCPTSNEKIKSRFFIAPTHSLSYKRLRLIGTKTKLDNANQPTAEQRPNIISVSYKEASHSPLFFIPTPVKKTHVIF